MRLLSPSAVGNNMIDEDVKFVVETLKMLAENKTSARITFNMLNGKLGDDINIVQNIKRETMPKVIVELNRS